MKRSDRLQREGGFVLITLYLLLAVCLAYLTAMISHSFAEVRASQRLQLVGQAFYLAEGGVDTAFHWLRTQNPPPPGSSALTLPSTVGGWQPLGAGGSVVTVIPFGDNIRYRIDSVGTTGTLASPTSQSNTRLTVQAQSFSLYAYFTDSERSASGGLIWFTSRDHLTGPVHSNDQFSMTGNPIFDGPVSSVASSLNLASGATPAFNGGLSLSAARISLPSVGATALGPSASSGGLSLAGDTTVALQSDGTMLVTNAGKGWTNSVQPLPGNGVLYVSGGNVTLSGTLKGQMTVATDQDVQVADKILYSVDPRTNPASTDLLGIVAGGNIVVNQSAPTNLEIDASMMALSGSFTVQNYDTVMKGTLTVYGGMVQSRRGPVGTFNSSTGTKVSGYTKDYRYDNRLLGMMPPAFPTTGQYNSVVWEEP